MRPTEEDVYQQPFRLEYVYWRNKKNFGLLFGPLYYVDFYGRPIDMADRLYLWLLPLFYYYRVLRAIIYYVVSQSTAASSASCKRSRPPSNLFNGQELTMCDIVWISLQLVRCRWNPLLVARITVALACPKTIQQRPLTPVKIKTGKSDCGVYH